MACVSGGIGASCAADTDCDGATGAGDASCGACPITAGPTTENEMFVLTGKRVEAEPDCLSWGASRPQLHGGTAHLGMRTRSGARASPLGATRRRLRGALR